MHNNCLAHDYCVYEIFSLLSILVVILQVRFINFIPMQVFHKSLRTP